MPNENLAADMTDGRHNGGLCQQYVLTFRHTKITVCHIVLTIFLAFIFTLSASSQEGIPKLNAPMNETNLKKWREFVGSEAPIEQRFKVASSITRRLQLKRDWASVIRESLAYMEGLKDSKESEQRKQLQDLIGQIANYLIMQTAKRDEFDIFEKFVLDNRNKDEGLTGLKMMTAHFNNTRKWDSASILWNKYKKYYPDYQDFFDQTITLLQRKDRKVLIRNFGSGINTAGSEWDPNLSPDGETLLFTTVKQGGFGQADIWQSQKIDGNWTKPENLGANINSNANETIDNVSPDGNTIFISGDFAGTFGNFDIYTAKKTKYGWGGLEHFPMPINSEYQDEACNLTADGNALIFSSDRKGAIGDFLQFGNIRNGSDMGNMDIWISEKDKDGRWGQPINLGKKINTPFAERAPYLHPDGKTLYFSSNARPGLGKLDVYKSTRLSDTSWTEWSEPINLGKEINTVEDDWGYVINSSGDSAVFAARNRTIGYGNWDLYSVSLPEEAKPEQICVISGYIADLMGNPIGTEVVWEDLSTKQIIGRTSSDPQTGRYFISLPLGKFYGYYAKKDGYYPASNNINLVGVKEGSSFRVDITLVSIKDLKNDEAITLNNLFFDYNDSSIKQESIPELDRIARFLDQNKEVKIKIEGHTDNQGSASYNKKLSRDRAKQVKAYLIKMGVNKSRLKAQGFGATKPAFANTGEQNMSKNRRVEIRIMDK